MKNSTMLMLATLLMLLAGCSDSPYQPGSVPSAELKSIQAGRKQFPRKCRDILENGEEFTLYSLDPSAKTNANPAQNFYNYAILGKVQIKDPKERKTLLNALYGGMGGRQSRCFEPRHGIRAKKGDQVADLVICFQCGGIYVSVSDEQLTVKQTPAPTFNRILTAPKSPSQSEMLLPLARDKRLLDEHRLIGGVRVSRTLTSLVIPGGQSIQSAGAVYDFNPTARHVVYRRAEL